MTERHDLLVRLVRELRVAVHELDAEQRAAGDVSTPKHSIAHREARQLDRVLVLTGR